MKISWGYRVTILYLGFAALIIYFVTRSVNEKVDLVTPDYYAQELKYQDKIESISRTNELTTSMVIEYNDAGLNVMFPTDFKGKKIEGSIHLFRPSDNTKDVSIDIAPDGNLNQNIPTDALTKGLYRVKVDYTVEGASYYSEKQIVIR